jgi:hypothetical protein
MVPPAADGPSIEIPAPGVQTRRASGYGHSGRCRREGFRDREGHTCHVVRAYARPPAPDLLTSRGAGCQRGCTPSGPDTSPALPIGAENLPGKISVKVERPQRSEDVRPNGDLLWCETARRPGRRSGYPCRRGAAGPLRPGTACLPAAGQATGGAPPLTCSSWRPRSSRLTNLRSASRSFTESAGAGTARRAGGVPLKP